MWNYSHKKCQVKTDLENIIGILLSQRGAGETAAPTLIVYRPGGREDGRFPRMLTEEEELSGTREEASSGESTHLQAGSPSH